MRAQFVYEKFTQESDPVRDLGIGAYKTLFEKELDYVKSMFISDVAEYFFNERGCTSSARCVKDIMKDIIESNNYSIHNMRNMYLENTRNYSLNDFGHKIVRDYFKRKFDIDFRNYKKTI